ncbi:toast rack family protein [Dethiobacter alkaliphilus]|uniref:DUF2154 domain-containing protein n=1 Tax=Dethiobacter alkaliphilus AHT 1 TaxID=555088 RepID=C0GJS5_DETAL|nr:toast rack family protein [Dethiobacter alkaliphilus]EEG76383.1 hypothetical protein DealDRAFT_2728 [Dethiobacter alkaliphilus AHT 1]
MKADRIVLGLGLAVLGLVWFLVNFGVISPVAARELWRFWPLLLILWGVLLILGKGSGLGGCLIGILVFLFFFGGLFGVYLPGIEGPSPGTETTNVTIPASDEVENVTLDLRQGAGEVYLSSHAGPDILRASLTGTPRPIIEQEVSDGTLQVEIKDEAHSWTIGNRTNRWNLELAEDIPTEISLRAGAGRSDLDLSRLQVHDLSVQTGAGDLTVRLGQVESQVLVEGGAGSITFYVPDNTGVRLQTSGLLNVSAGEVNLKRLDGGDYESENLDNKAAVVDIEVKAGVGSVNLRRAR